MPAEIVSRNSRSERDNRASVIRAIYTKHEHKSHSIRKWQIKTERVQLRLNSWVTIHLQLILGMFLATLLCLDV